MIAPQNFHVNPDTVSTNAFQNSTNTHIYAQNIHSSARKEFDKFVEALIQHHVKVHVYEGISSCNSPDRIFPNNWVSFHAHRNMMYPMQPINRRTEKQQNIWDVIPKEYKNRELVDWSHHELQGRFLEGTGSLVLDRKNRIALAALSARTNESLVREWCQFMNYQPIVFVAQLNETDIPVYHTNVVASITAKHLFIAIDCITDESAKKQIRDYAEKFDKTLVKLSRQQTAEFAGNILEFQDSRNSSCIAISTRALHSLTPTQVKILEAIGNVIPADLTCIENYGGGSARCMIAELY